MNANCRRRAGAVQRQLAFALSAPLVLMWQLRAAARRLKAARRDGRLEHGAHGAVRRSRGAARRARARSRALVVDRARNLFASLRGRVMKVRLLHGLTMGAYQRPAEAAGGRVRMGLNLERFLRRLSLGCVAARARVFVRDRERCKKLPHRSRTSRGLQNNPWMVGMGGVGLTKGP